MNELNNDTFFINLLSNKSLEYHNENNESNFINQFDKHIVLIRRMEVALFQITLPKISNVPELKFSLIIKENDMEYILLEKYFRQDLLTSEDKLNESLNSLCQTSIDELRKLLRDYHEIKRRTNLIYSYFNIPSVYFINNIAFYTVPKIQFNATSITHDIPLKNKHIEAYWKIDNYLENNFGYKTILKESIENKDELKADLDNNGKVFLPTLNHISICSDIIESSFVGNSKLNLLRIISKSTLNKKNNSINFNPLIFVPIRKNLIESINICLLDEKQNYLLLEKGLTTVVLLLRPIEHI